MASSSTAQGPGRHSLDDHRLGADAFHEHDGLADHDHDDDFAEGGVDAALWAQDNVVLHSVGIDIGSSGTQVVFSKIHMQRIADQLSTRYVVASCEVLYQSPIALTPYHSDSLIDAEKLGEIVDDAYRAAELAPDDIDAGAVILTGEALRRENAEAIAAMLAEHGGEFVCATAGHHMEAMLAVYGAGAARRSYETQTRILNIDIGGGTTKLALVERGELKWTAAIHLGGRLIVVDDQNTLTRLDPAGHAHAHNAGFDWQLGDRVGRDQLQRVAEWMAEELFALLGGKKDAHALLLTEPLGSLDRLDGIMFSGGVGEFVYGRERRDFGDLGKLFGNAIAERLQHGDFPAPLLPAGECIRATALGASEYTMQLSGGTNFVSNPGALLPRKNLPVVPLTSAVGEDIIEADEVQAALTSALARHDVQEGGQDYAISLHWRGAPSYERVSTLARGLLAALPNAVRDRRPIYLVVDGDIAQTLGQLIKQDLQLPGELLVIDGVSLWGFDFVDLGRIRMPSLTIPVTIKSLMFGADLRMSDVAVSQQHKAAHSHGHGHEHSHGDGGTHAHDHVHDGHAHEHEQHHADVSPKAIDRR